MLIQADARRLPLRDGCVQCVVTSPPYFGLRDYGHTDQIGLEPTPDGYVSALVEVFREVRRVLTNDGTVWINLGDSYANDTKWGGQTSGKHASALHGKTLVRAKRSLGLKSKDLIGIPWRVAFALQADGWVLRQEIIWEKPNPMPESVRDRCTKAHESLFMFAKARWSGPAPSQFAHISNEDARWLALLFDTEGNIVVKRATMATGRTTYGLQVAFANTSKPLMELAQSIVGAGSLHERPGKNAPVWYWQLTNIQASELMKRVHPFLVVKQWQARLGVYVQSLFETSRIERLSKKGQLRGRTRSDEHTATLERCWATMKMLNHFGQPDLSWVPDHTVGKWADCERYYYEAAAIAEPVSLAMEQQIADGYEGLGLNRDRSESLLTRNRRTVWTIPTMPYAGAHFATMPEKLVEPCILAGCPLGGLVLDPFIGSGTVGAVAERLGRRWVGTDLAYHDLSAERTAQRGFPFRQSMTMRRPDQGEGSTP